MLCLSGVESLIRSTEINSLAHNSSVQATSNNHENSEVWGFKAQILISLKRMYNSHGSLGSQISLFGHAVCAQKISSKIIGTREISQMLNTPSPGTDLYRAIQITNELDQLN